MKGYLVNIENNEFENYLIYLDDIPSYDKNKNQWFGFGEPIVVDKNNISRNVKLPAKGEMTEVNILIVNNEPSKFYQGCKVKYNVFDWSSFFVWWLDLWWMCQSIYYRSSRYRLA